MWVILGAPRKNNYNAKPGFLGGVSWYRLFNHLAELPQFTELKVRPCRGSEVVVIYPDLYLHVSPN